MFMITMVMNKTMHFMQVTRVDLFSFQPFLVSLSSFFFLFFFAVNNIFQYNNKNSDSNRSRIASGHILAGYMKIIEID